MLKVGEVGPTQTLLSTNNELQFLPTLVAQNLSINCRYQNTSYKAQSTKKHSRVQLGYTAHLIRTNPTRTLVNPFCYPFQFTLIVQNPNFT